ncbi:MAG: universal stress protein [Gammaproteobacteria bacterium]|nr:universal stress protein [Hydrogenophaga sp.]MBU4183846.1 universal stress protein [Gammaproteobacteria bacterium]PKO76765.1 MAG: hypothetical protein CVU21_11480 [Betaproteobacteria bacterium HGW-Betaproteobacteria-15]MBU4281297.1 universal stress protein [Gammaproteobacteria bacterium]MBU4322396.1 universal stress protein [Gammaproteobacteria bacterium]MBU4507987.1 universal stress protein [Gammaproteobacteria bacterium]
MSLKLLLAVDGSRYTRRMVLGSVTAAVLAHSHVPVLVVR